MTKNELRRDMRRLKQSYAADELRVLSAVAVARLEEHHLFRNATTVLLYHSLPDEVDTHALVRRAATGKRVLLPAVVSSERLALRPYCGEAQMQQGAFGIGEPVGDDVVDFSTIDLAVVPGMAFDTAGHRLGRGRGYYDRLLLQLRRAGVPIVGLCFPFQRVSDVPVEAHDIAVDEVIS